MKHSILYISTLMLLGICLACNPDGKSTSNLMKDPDKPNILFIFSDDQDYSTIHALGNHEIKTPNLDKLVKSGVTFSNAYNMGSWSGAVCIASRAMLNTGSFVWRAHQQELEYRDYDGSERDLLVDGVITRKTHQEKPLPRPMWGNLMQQAGYETYFTGKWHVRRNPSDVFNKVKNERPGMPSDYTEGYNRPLHENDTVWQPWDTKWEGFWEGGKHWSEVLGDDAIAFIDSAKDRDNPFFMYLAFNAPHDPRQSPKEYVDMYPLENISIPASYMPEYPYKDGIGCGPGLRDEKLAPFPRTEHAVKVNRQEYYAIITHMDHQIGRIMDALEKSGKADNTYIFFTSDHGLAVGKHGLIGKQNMYDHSVRAPLIVVGPNVSKNNKIDVDVYIQDIMASTLELAGIEKPEYIDFNSLLPFIRKEREESFYPAIYGAYREDMQRMIRADGYKLIVYPRIKMMRLFDLDNDPLEMNDLAQNSDFKEIKANLYKRLIQLQIEMDDPLNLAAVFSEKQL
jgi:arylsulfatase A-like enzyme